MVAKLLVMMMMLQADIAVLSGRQLSFSSLKSDKDAGKNPIHRFLQVNTAPFDIKAVQYMETDSYDA
ncbi:hypothetical protein JOE33_002869 [Pseudomonas sp. PvP027]|uniref:hypothetical protein n=1 Tax=Pseudomonas TaxID=286 RepID=UPI0016566818|nr:MULTISPECIES: hypothetical protein [Pseudomonas]MBC8800741.1 hypothetical protein [Pseudomonas congelans]MBP1145946.1 hypothetical protein [Pseudomonas sp. PvP027]